MDRITELINENLEAINLDFLKDKGLFYNGKVNDRYVKLLRNYRVLFEKYLMSELQLTAYDNILYSSGLHFLPIRPDDMECYQGTSTMKLNYIYLRNYLHVEKLSIDDINLIIGLSEEQLAQGSKELHELIEATYRSVIDSNFDSSVRRKNCYGLDSDRFWYDSDNIVFGIRYYEYENGLDNEDDWFANRELQLKLINSLKDKMEREISEKLGINAGVILYKELVIKKQLR